MRFGSSCGSRPRSKRLDAARRFLISIHTTAFAFVVGDLKEQTAADAVCSVKSRNHLKKKKKKHIFTFMMSPMQRFEHLKRFRILFVKKP